VSESNSERADAARLKALYEEKILDAEKTGDLSTMQIYAQLISNLTVSHDK
jgi:hypothetical protein